MRILSLVSLVSPDGAYGGPLRVAVNQAAALIAAGHEVTLAAATRGYPVPPREVDGVPARLFPARTVLPGTGFAGIASPGLNRWLRAHLHDFDVVHLHLARDLVTLPAARLVQRAGLRYVVQPHGMIDVSTNPLAGPLDAFFTLPILRGAAAVFHLTDAERDDLTQVAGALAYQPLPNGVPTATPGPAWRAEPEVLFLARLAPRKRPVVFVEAARLLADRFPQARFALVGPDEGEGAAVEAAIAAARDAGVQIAWEGPLGLDATVERMRAAEIYVLPSVDEPYGMTVIEAMSVGRPVVVTDSCGLADFVSSHQAGRVAGTDVASLAEAIGALLADPGTAQEQGRNGLQAVRAELSMEAIAARLAQVYRQDVPA